MTDICSLYVTNLFFKPLIENIQFIIHHSIIFYFHKQLNKYTKCRYLLGFFARQIVQGLPKQWTHLTKNKVKLFVKRNVRFSSAYEIKHWREVSNTIIKKVTSKMITYLDPGIELPMLNVFESTQGVVTGNFDKGPQCTMILFEYSLRSSWTGSNQLHGIPPFLTPAM